MKKLLLLFLLLFTSFYLFAQAPQRMSYQAVIRNSSNNLVANSAVRIRISILQGSTLGPVVYSETHAPTTNANGLVSIEIGGGANVSGSFSNIKWASGPFFIRTETDPTGGTNYTVTAVSQLLSVPYALHADCVSSTLLGDTLNVGCKTYILPGILETRVVDHSCGTTNVHNSALAYGTMSDQEGNIYRTIKIGNQTWMAENLRTSKYRNGTAIANITDNAQWANSTTGAYSSYNNNTSNDCPYGKLYNWYAVANTNQICPTGWHVPDDIEWNTLINFLGGATVAPGKMKSTGTQLWEAPNTNATNSSGFSGLPGGLRYFDGVFFDLKRASNFWIATEFSTTDGLFRNLSFNNGNSNRFNGSKAYGFSVRCVKD